MHAQDTRVGSIITHVITGNSGTLSVLGTGCEGKHSQCYREGRGPRLEDFDDVLDFHVVNFVVALLVSIYLF